MCTAEGTTSHYPIDKAGVWVDCVRQGRPVIHNDYASLPDRKGMPAGHAPVVRELVVPVYRGAKIVAVLGVGNKPTDYVDADVKVVSDIAGMAWDIVGRKRAEKELRQSEETYRTLLSNLNSGVIVHAPDTSILIANPTACTLLGLSEEQMKGKEAIDPQWKFLREDGTDMPLEEYPVNWVLARNEPLRNMVVGVNRPQSGDTVWVLANGFSVLDESGQIEQIVINFVDITERKRAVEAMRVVAEELSGLTGDDLFQTLVRRLVEILGVAYAAVGEWDETRPQMISTAAFCAQGEIGENISYELPGSPCEQVFGQRLCIYADSVAETFPQDHMLSDVHARSYAGVPLFSSAGDPLGLLWIIGTKPLEDTEFVSSVLASFSIRVSAELERKRIEGAIRESEQRYRTLFETAGDAIFLMEGDKFIDCNPKTLEMFATPRDQIIGAPPYKFSPPTQPDGRNSKDKAIEKITAAFAGEPQFFEWEHCQLDGTTFAAEVSLSAMELQGKPHLLAIVRDVSERKRVEAELARSSELKSKVIQVAGHELRTPLSYIMAMPRLMEGVSDTGKLKHAMETMEAKARRLSEIVQSMFKLMPGQDYGQHLDLREVALADILEGVRSDCLPFVDERDQSLVIEQAEGLPNLRVDPNKIHDALENVIGNAIKFTPEGGTIRVVAAREDSRHIRIEIADQGPGIPPGDLPNIFTPFYSIDDVMKHSSGSIGKTKHGMGLGLAVVKHFTEMHGGSVSVATGEQGSTFTLVLPIDRPAEPTSRPHTDDWQAI